MTQQECTLVEPLAPEPAGHFVVALAGVARTARRRDVVECVSPAPGERLHTVPLQRHVCRPAVSTATPCGLERGPLLDAQVVLDAIHPTLAPTGVLGFPTTCDRHLPRLVGRQVGCGSDISVFRMPAWPRTAPRSDWRAWDLCRP